MYNSKLQDIIKSVKDDYRVGRDMDTVSESSKLPDRDRVLEVLDKTIRVVFPAFYREDAATLMEDIEYELSKQLIIVLERQECTKDNPKELANDISLDFLSRIPKIREYVDTDVQATFEGDPAAFSKDEVILAYPGLFAVTVYRIAHELYELGVPIIPRIMTEYAHSQTGIDINPGATIGKHFCIDHGTGIVVGETTIIGENVKVYQGVTIGALSTSGGQRLKNVKRHPTIEDNVTIYAGASILGGDTVIGANSVIGANVFITKSIPPYTKMAIRNQDLQIKGDPGSEDVCGLDFSLL